jgi:hypothetical protein
MVSQKQCVTSIGKMQCEKTKGLTMLPIIEIMSDPVNRRGTSQASGKEYNIWFQEAYLHSASSHYPVKFEFLVRDGVVLPRGRHTLTDRCFYVDQKGRLSVRLEEGLATLEAVAAGLSDQVKSLKVAA